MGEADGESLLVAGTLCWEDETGLRGVRHTPQMVESWALFPCMKMQAGRTPDQES